MFSRGHLERSARGLVVALLASCSADSNVGDAECGGSRF
jgi:hypothetical protein